MPQGQGHHNSVSQMLYARSQLSCQLTLWEETGVPGENPWLSAERWLYSFHMRTGFESTLLGIELGTLEVKGEWSDHYTTEAPKSRDLNVLLFIVGIFMVENKLFKCALPMPACSEPSTAFVLMSYVSLPRFPLLCFDDVLILFIFHIGHLMSKMLARPAISSLIMLFNAIGPWTR